MTVSVEQAQLSLKELIQKTSHGEEVVITQDQKPVAELRSLAVVDSPSTDAQRAWLEFQNLGKELAATSVDGAPSLTDAVSQARLLDVRHAIEVGWQQSERGQVVDGLAVFAEIRRMSLSMRLADKAT